MAGGQERVLKRRIKSVESTKKITRAMELIAASRIVKAQQRVAAARPYSEQITEVIRNLAAAGAGSSGHPLLSERETVHKVGFVVITADRGLAGGYNSNLLRRTERFITDEKPRYERIELELIGRKAKEHFKRRPSAQVAAEHPGVTSETALARARELAAQVSRDFLDGKIDAVMVVYNEFKSAISQNVSIEPLLPLRTAELPPNEGRFDFE